MRRRTRVYVAGPITGPKDNKDRYDTICHNLSTGMTVGNQLLQVGYAPLIPHYSHFWNLMFPGQDYSAWLEYDLAWLEVSDVLLRLPGGSEGADKEVAWAHTLGIPICYSLEEVYQRVPPQAGEA